MSKIKNTTTEEVEKKKSLGWTATGPLGKFSQYMDQFLIFAEREQEVKMMAYALLMREHVLLEGIPGSAKSLLASSVLGNITGGKFFKQQFTAFMDEQYIFGPQLFDELKKGKVIHNIKNSIVDCDFAFLDEFMNANEQVLNSTNEVLNERTFTRNHQRVNCPLITAVMTTNKNRHGEKDLAAVYDRIMFISEVRQVDGEDARREMYINSMAGKFKKFETFSLEDLKKCHEIIDKSKVKYSMGVLDCFTNLTKKFEEETKRTISDRTAIKSLLFLKIVALLEQSDRVMIDHCKYLKMIFCKTNDTNDEANFDAIFVRISGDYKKLESEIRLVNEIEKTMKQVKENSKKATGYSDYKSLHNIASGLMKKIKLETQDLQKEAKNSIDRVQEELDDIIEVIKSKVIEFRSRKGDTGAENDTDWIGNLGKSQEEGKDEN